MLCSVQMVDIVIALCLAHIAASYQRQQVQLLILSKLYSILSFLGGKTKFHIYYQELHVSMQCHLFIMSMCTQLSRQQNSCYEYGKGVESILMKEDSSLLLFVALV